ncbi:hypothetical protein ACFZCU_45290 [Streptomyces canus]|jgi:hypothetical protein|uniref:hypothetical protein n=1 Tax=Streptomyces canus TaxID=58343 RepID=UPI0036E5427E
MTTTAHPGVTGYGGDELTEHQARVLCAAMKTVERLAIAYRAAPEAQDTPLTLVVKALMPLLR